jgi:hypothetical protein
MLVSEWINSLHLNFITLSHDIVTRFHPIFCEHTVNSCILQAILVRIPTAGRNTTTASGEGLKLLHDVTTLRVLYI